MKLLYNEIAIRNANPSDAELLAAWWNDGNIMAHAGFPLGLGTNSQKIAKELEEDSDTTRRRLILLFRDVPIGEMCYKNIGNATADIGIKICRTEFQEKGIGRMALSMLISYLFSFGYRKVVLDTNLNNRRAQHVYEMLGFRKVRINIDSWYNQLGKPESSVDYELTIDQFHNYAV